MNKLRYSISASLIILFCVFSLAIPALAANWQENLLMQKPTQRVGAQDILSEDARKIPVVYAVHKRKLAEGFYAGSEIEFTPELKQEMLAVLQGLTAAEIMPQNAYDEICAAFEIPNVQIYCREDKAGFRGIELTSVKMQGETITENITELLLQWSSDTALATSISYRGTQLDVDKAVKAYQKYLGVDMLPDWHKVNNTDAIYSDMAQLYMQCKARYNMVSFTIAPISREEISNK